jgi:hypothetical protein
VNYTQVPTRGTTLIIWFGGKEGKMDTSDIYTSGVLNKGEEIIECIKGRYYTNKNKNKGLKKKNKGLIVFTNKRLLFLQKPRGHRAKGFNVLLFYSWGDILSASTLGLISKRLNVNVKRNEAIEIFVFSCDKVEDIARKIVERKNSYTEEKVVEAKKVVIEEANKDKAEEILKKRLARGERSLEEFHQKIQRT